MRGTWRGSLTARLTLVATALTGVALLVLLAALYAVLAGRYQDAVDVGLRARYGDLQSAVLRGDPSALSGELYAELHLPSGVTTSSPGLEDVAPLLADAAGVTGTRLFDHSLDRPGRSSEPVRVLVGREPDGSVLAVATSRRPQQDASRQLLEAFAVTGPLLLALVAVVVSRVTRAALRPVGALARRAERISEGRDAARRLPPLPGDNELARLSRTFDAMLERLAVAFDRERAFVDDASHELRTPITVLRGELELALSDLADHEGVEHSLRAALTEAERLSRLAEDLLVLARESAGSLGMQSDPLDVPDLLERTAGRMAVATGLEIRTQSQALVANGDAARLEQLFGNLVNNAAEAGAHRVLLRAEADGPDLVLAVEDDGPGFPEGFAESAFERFSRADHARTRTTGAGLGLALVAAIAAAAGGSVRTVRGRDLPGACVQVRLPLAGPPRGPGPVDAVD